MIPLLSFIFTFFLIAITDMSGIDNTRYGVEFTALYYILVPIASAAFSIMMMVIMVKLRARH